MRYLLHRPSPAMVVAVIALFIAFGGTGYAASQLGSPHAVTSKKRAKARGHRGRRGPRGPQGASGPQGPAGTALAYANVSPAGTVAAGGSKNVAQNNVTHPRPGTYCITGLTVAPHNVVATVDANTGGGTPTITAGLSPPVSRGCPAGAQALVSTGDGATPVDRAFFLLLN